MTDVVIRDAVEEDVEQIVDVYESVAAEGRWIGGELPVDKDRHRAGRLETIRSPDGVLLVAEVDGVIVGELSYRISRGRAELGMEIADGQRGKGVGRALMEAAIERARSQDLDKMFLHVWPHNEAAIAMYEKLGFVREGYHPKQYRRRSGEAWDAISMGLVLKP